MTRRPGFSLVEVLMAIVILCVLGMAAVGGLTQAARDADAMSDQTLSLLLSQKILEETFQAVHDDPYADLLLREESSAPRPLAGDQAPFFRVLEDTAAPFGRLSAPADLALDRRAPQLLGFYQGFQVGFRATPGAVRELPGAPPLVVDLALQFTWRSARGADAALNMGAVLTRPRIPPPAEDRVPRADALEAAIVAQLFPDRAGQPLAGVLAAVGGDPASLRELGAVVVVVNGALAAASAPEEVLPAGLSAEERHRRRGKEHERIAAAAFGALVFARPLVASLLARIASGGVPPLRAEVREGIRAVMARGADVRAALLDRSAFALDEYLRAIRSRPRPSVRPFRDLMLDRKVLELLELRHFLTGSTDLSYLREYIDHRLEEHRDRNRWLQHHFEHERREATSLDALARLHPEVKTRAAQAVAAAGLLPELAAALASFPVR